MESFASSLWELFLRGGPIMVPLLLASVLGLAVILERLIVFARAYQSFDRVTRTLQPLVLARSWSRAEDYCSRRGPLTELARVYFQQRDRPQVIRETALRREGTLILGRLDKHLRLLAALAQIGTLLGLLGTFYFMIYRFNPAATNGGQLQQADFFAAIWESFLSTMFGLVIAIPCMTAFQLFEGRVDNISRQLSVLVAYLDEWRHLADEQAARSSRNDTLTAADKTPIAR